MSNAASARPKPSAANILSSLGIKGAVNGVPEGIDQASLANYIPVLDKDGKLSVKFIPSSAMEMTVNPLSNVLVVDQNSVATHETGSFVAPFKSIDSAAAAVKADSSGRCAILLMPGLYQATYNSIANFSSNYPDADGPSSVFIIGLGECVLDASTFNIDGIDSSGGGATVVLKNICTDSNIKVYASAAVVCMGRTVVSGSIIAEAGSSVKLSSESRVAKAIVAESSPEQALPISYLSDSSHVGNDSNIPGDTVDKALNRLGSRKIRVANITFDDTGFHFDNDSFTDMPAEAVASPSGDFDIYDLRQRQKIFVDGINRLVKLNKNIVAESVTADTIRAGLIETDKLKMDALVLGGYKLTIDPYGYLVVADADTPITPPSEVILISDSAPGNDNVYALIVVNGRMKILNADLLDDVDDTDPYGVVTELTIVDSSTGVEYTVHAEDGRLVLSGPDSSVVIAST